MAKDWEPLKEEIRKLYLSQDKSLDEVIRLLRGRHNFIASERSYRTQLRKWGFMKYSTQAFPKPRRARTSNHSRRQPTATLSSPEGIHILSRESSLMRDLHTISAFDTGRDNLNFLTPHVSSISPSGFPFTSSVRDPRDPMLRFLQDSQDDEVQTRLRRAIMENDMEEVRHSLDAGAAVDIRDHMGQTLLHHAVVAHNVEICRLILRFGADVNAQDQLGVAPLHLAISRPSLIQPLIHAGANASIQDTKGNSPLHLILSDKSWGGSVNSSSAVDLLLKLGADVNRENNAGLTPFLQLLDRPYSQKGVVVTIQSFLQAGGSVLKSLPDGRTPLQIFLSWAKTELLDWSPDDAEDHVNDSEHHVNDSEKHETHILRHFLVKGASVVTPLPSGKPLISAYCEDKFFRWRKDINLGKELFKRLTSDEAEEIQDSALIELASDVHKWQRTEIGEFIQVLLRHGADPNHEDFLGKTSLLRLFDKPRGKPMVIESALVPLLRHGADPWQQAFDGTCALFEAASMFPKENFVRMMLQSDLRRPHSTRGPEAKHSTDLSSDLSSEPWNEWRQAARAVDWSEAKRLILREPRSPTEKISKVIKESAFAALAEKHVYLARDKFRDDAAGMERKRKYVAGIFRDCTKFGVILDAEWIECLVDICLT